MVENNSTMDSAFQIILHAGNGKSSSMEAIQIAKEGNFKKAKDKIEEASKEISEAHKYQTEFLQKEASGEKTDLNLILIHSQDHLMNAMTVKDLASEFIDLYENIKEEKDDK